MPLPMPAPSSPASARLLPWAERWALPLLVLPLYVQGLSRWPLWEAELWTIRTCTYPLGEMLRLVAKDRHPPLFFLLEWLLVRISGADAMVRAPAALAALGTVIAGQALARRHLGRLEAWLLGLLLATSPFLVAYAANARSGTLTGLLGLVALSLGLDLVVGERPRRAALGMGLALTAGLYVHYSMVLALGGLALGLPLALAMDPRARPQRLQRLGLAIAALGLPILAFLPWLLGPLRRQELGLEPVARSLQVFRYLFWPVGPQYLPPGALVLAGLALLGLVLQLRVPARAGMWAGWALAAVLIPYLWSTNSGTHGKFYLYAPVQGFFLCLAAIGLAAAVRLLSRALGRPLSVVLASLALLAASAVPLRQVLVPHSNLVSVVPTSPGTWDARIDAEALRSAPVDHPPGIVPEGGAAQLWLHYAPELDVMRRAPGEPPRMGWRALSRRGETEQSLSASASSGCALTEAFADLLVVPPARDCERLLAHLTRIGEHLHYGPYLMETAQQAWIGGDLARAEEYARGAAADSPVSPRPHLLLARILLDAGRFPEATITLDQGMGKAARYGDLEAWRDLARLNVEAARGSGDPEQEQAAQDLVACLRARSGLLAATCDGGILGLL